MKNRYTIFLLYSCAVIIVLICAIQIYSLSVYFTVWDISMNIDTYHRFRAVQSITLILSVIAISLLLSKEEINRGLKRKAYTDITGIMNKHACLERMSILDCNDSTLNIGFAMFDLNNLKKVNDFYGHEEGDNLIQNFVQILRQASEKKYFLGRFGGDEFITIIENCSEELMETYIEKIREMTDKFNRGHAIRLSYACGYAISTRGHYYLMDDLLKEADKKMYDNKKMIKSRDLFETGQISKILDIEKTVPAEREFTTLYDYEAFVTAVGKVIRISGNDAHFAIVCSDIYNFGYINDVYGHKEGNIILKRFAVELSSQPFCLCACRTHSDNFACLMDLSRMSNEESIELIRNWNMHFSQLMNESYKGSRLLVKSGIYFISDANEPVEVMLNNANYAHKFAKTTHHNVFVYCEGLSHAARRRSEIIHSFQNALERQEFEVFVQPQVCCADKSICGAEALVRWKRRDGAFFYPNEFIPVLEKTGDIIDLDFYVYEKVFCYLYDNDPLGKSHIPISVNVSRIHLLKIDEFIDRLQALRNRYPIPASMIMFELTETAYIQEIEDAHRFIHELHELGYRISMDDFGSGYSSLKALQTMPFDEIKFDRAFLSKDIDKKESPILLQIMSMVKRLNIPIVCEGAETAEHVELLERSACDIIQGYYYYKPFPLEELKNRSLVPADHKQSNSPLLCG